MLAEGVCYDDTNTIEVHLEDSGDASLTWVTPDDGAETFNALPSEDQEALINSIERTLEVFGHLLGGIAMVPDAADSAIEQLRHALAAALRGMDERIADIVDSVSY